MQCCFRRYVSIGTPALYSPSDGRSTRRLTVDDARWSGAKQQQAKEDSDGGEGDGRWTEARWREYWEVSARRSTGLARGEARGCQARARARASEWLWSGASCLRCRLGGGRTVAQSRRPYGVFTIQRTLESRRWRFGSRIAMEADVVTVAEEAVAVAVAGAVHQTVDACVTRRHVTTGRPRGGRHMHIAHPSHTLKSVYFVRVRSTTVHSPARPSMDPEEAHTDRTLSTAAHYRPLPSTTATAHRPPSTVHRPPSASAAH